MLLSKFAAVASIATFLIGSGVASAQPRMVTEKVYVTMSNDPNSNSLLAFNDLSFPIVSVPTMGKGGAAGNAGAVQVCGQGSYAVVVLANHNSSDISIMFPTTNTLTGQINGFQVGQKIKTASGPQTLICDDVTEHLIVGEDNNVESFRYDDNGFFSPKDDGNITTGNPTIAQVAVANGKVYYSMKAVGQSAAGGLYTTPLTPKGIGSIGKNIPLPDYSDTPFALAALPDGSAVVLALAHVPALVYVDTTTDKVMYSAKDPTPFKGGMGDATCWLAIYGKGPYVIFGGDSPNNSIQEWLLLSNFVQYGQVGAKLPGLPTDVTVDGNKLAAIYAGSDGQAYLAAFTISPSGGLSQDWTAGGTQPGIFNGVAIYTNTYKAQK